MLNQIANSDCLEYLKTIESESANTVIIDEPYGVLGNHKIEEGYNLDVALQVRKEYYRILKKDGIFYFLGSSHRLGNLEI